MEKIRQEIMEKTVAMGVTVKGLENVPWIVQGRPLFDLEGVDGEVLSEFGKNTQALYLDQGIMNIAMFPDGRVEGLKNVSRQYKMLQHLEALNIALDHTPESFNLRSIDIKTSPNGGRIWAKMTSGQSQEIVPGDNIQFQAVLQNSADTSKVMRFLAGAFRMICSNGMVVPDSRFDNLDIKKAHKGSLNFEKDAGLFFANMEEQFEAVGHWKRYAEIKLDHPAMEGVFEELSTGPRVQEELLSIPLRGQNTTLDQLIQGGNATLWDGYNAFTQRITDSDSLEAVKIDANIKVSRTFDKMVDAA